MRLSVLALLAFSATASLAQAPSRIRVINAADSTSLAGVVVRGGPASARTGPDGEATLSLAVQTTVIATRIGFAPDSASVAPGASVVIALQPSTEIEGMVIAATRSGRRIDDEPLRVEVLEREEIEEKIRMTPGDITMMLNETTGLRVQTTSPSLGGANVRVQGMRGRYTQILSDGLPLFGGQTGGLGLLQIPPMDLGGVEVIKGAASALYGGNALGGVINLISRQPGEEPTAEILVNQTMLHGSDLIGFGAGRLNEAWGASGLAGIHRQAARSPKGESWQYTPQFDRLVLRPRLFWSAPEGHTAMLTAGTTIENRSGGRPMGFLASPAHPEALETRRFDGGGIGQWVFGERVASLRGSVSTQGHEHTFGSVMENDRHTSALAEAALTQKFGTSSIVAGLAIQNDRYASRELPGFDFSFIVPAVFTQATFDAHHRVSITASARVDAHSEYGTHLSPRLSALLRLPADFTARISGGQGFFAPTPLNEETEVTGLTPVDPLVGIVAERARTASLDLGRHFGAVELNATAFRSTILDPIGVVDAGSGRLRLANMVDATETSGVELLSRWAVEPFHLTASYTFTDARERDPNSGVRRLVPLTPRHQAGFVGAWESDDMRAGAEVYYTGRQSLADNPYRAESKPYTHLGVLVERRFGRARIFVNAENLLNVRQVDTHPLTLPAPGAGGRMTTDAWGPLEGRTANAGVRW